LNVRSGDKNNSLDRWEVEDTVEVIAEIVVAITTTAVTVEDGITAAAAAAEAIVPDSPSLKHKWMTMASLQLLEGVEVEKQPLRLPFVSHKGLRLCLNLHLLARVQVSLPLALLQNQHLPWRRKKVRLH
jgi:hypothetical protein